MRQTYSLLLALLLIASAAEAAVSPQGRLLPDGPAAIVLSPAGGWRMAVAAVGGDCHRIVADLEISSADGGQSYTLAAVSGTAFLIDELGRAIVLTDDHPRRIPATLRVLDRSGEPLLEHQIFAMSDARLTDDGLRLACRSLDGVLLIDLASGEVSTHPALYPFAAGPGGLVAGYLAEAGELQVFLHGSPRHVLPANAGLRKLAFAKDGTTLFAIRAHELVSFDLPSGVRGVRYAAAPGEELRDLRIDGDAIRVGLRLADGDLITGEELILAGAGVERRAGPGARVHGRADGDERSHSPISWPLAPNQQQPVGNTYGEYQNYGSSYLHPGVDVMGAPGQPVYAVDSGVVKAVLTTSGQWHWRVAVGQPGNGTSEGYLYAHLAEPSIAVSVGDPIATGQYLGELVEWPNDGFTHVHFARLLDSGDQWSGNWLCPDNPNVDFTALSDPEPPVFEPARGSDLLAFCGNQSSSYLEPEALHGAVDIVAHVGDRILTSWVCAVQEIRYTIYRDGFPNNPLVDDKLAVNFDMALDTYSGGPIDPFLVGLLYKEDATCNTNGDYNSREFFHILTNSNGDENYESADLWEAWDTSGLPDAQYWIRVTAVDASGSATVDSMLVTTDNGNPTSAGDPFSGTAAFALYPNPTAGPTTISWSAPSSGTQRIELFDPSGRLLRTLLDERRGSGRASLLWDGSGDSGRPLPAGVYLLRRTDGGGSETVKVQKLR